MISPLRILSGLALYSIIPVCTAFAAPPDAGTIFNQQQTPGSTLPDRLPSDRDKGTVRSPLVDNGVKVNINKFVFTGGAGLATDAELQALLSDRLGKPLSFSDLQSLAARVTSYLRDEKGYPLAKAYLPGQDVTKGVIEIVIVSGKVDGKVKINIKDPSRIDKKILQGIADRNIPPSGAIRMDQLERATLLINDLPGITAQANLQPGSEPGTTKVSINASEGRLFSGSISGDNFGNRYTGEWRGTLAAGLNDPFGIGDQLTVSFMDAEKMYQGKATYTTQLFSSGVNFSLAYNGLHYELGKELSNLNASGTANTVSGNFSFPFTRSRNASIWGSLGMERLWLKDDANGTRSSERDIPIWNASVNSSFYDGFGGGALTSASFILTTGNVDISGPLAAKTADLSGPNSSGGFTAFSYSLARLQRATSLLSVYLSARGQFATENLDSSQKFILGGNSGVRAYPGGEGAGDEGHSFTFEPRLDIPGMPKWATTQLIGFVDTGWVKLHHKQWTGSVTSATGKNDYWLSGTGAGLVVGKSDLYTIRATYARTIGNNPGRTVAGNNSDNKNDDNRFWLTATAWF